MSREIKNPLFRKLMKEAGLEDIQLVKGDGYFYLVGDTDEAYDMIDRAERFDNENSFYLYSFNQQSPEDWVNDIKLYFKNLNDERLFEEVYKRRRDSV